MAVPGPLRGSSANEWPSPDAETIAFAVNLTFGGSGSGTATIRPDGSGLRWISQVLPEPDWQPVPVGSTGE